MKKRFLTFLMISSMVLSAIAPVSAKNAMFSESAAVTVEEETTRREEGTPNATMFLISDLHVQNVGSSAQTNFITAMEDMKTVDNDADALFTGGDYTEYGTDAHFTGYYTAVRGHSPVDPDEMIVSTGNHELRGPNNWGNSPEEELPYWDTFYNLFMRHNEPYMPETDGEVYYDRWIGASEDDPGYHVIVLNSVRALKDWAYYSDEEIDWLDEKMAENYDPTRPIFVVSHQPMPGTVRGGDSNNWARNERVKSVLGKYGNAVFISGHVHNRMESGTSYAVDREFGMAIDIPVFRDNGRGYYAEIYDDTLLFRARNFLTAEWLPEYDIEIDLPTMPSVYKAAKDKWAEDYTAASWAPVAAAKAEAEAMFAVTSHQGKEIRSEINAINERLVAAVAGLIRGETDKTPLTPLMAKAMALMSKTDIYPPAALAGLQAAIDDANAVLLDESAAQSDVILAGRALQAIFDDFENAAVPVFSVMPADDVKTDGDTATFTAEASIADGGALTYQWQRKNAEGAWQNIAGATGKSYTTGALALSDNGTQFRCVATNSKYNLTATAESDAATLVVVDRFSIVTFESNGGSAVPALYDIEPGSLIEEPAMPSRSGYYFDGWYTDADCTDAWDFAADIVTGDLTLFAKWVGWENMPAPLFKYDFEDENVLDLSGEPYGVTAKIPSASRKEGAGLLGGASLNMPANNGYVQIDANQHRYGTQSSFSISMWINPTAVNRQQYLFTSSPGDDWLLLRGGGFLGSYTLGTTGNPTFNASYAGINQDVMNIPANEWTHITVTISPEHATYYINGELLVETANTSWTGGSGPSNFFVFGGRYNLSSGTGGFTGDMDNIALYNETLSASQVKSLFAIETTPVTEEPEPFDRVPSFMDENGEAFDIDNSRSITATMAVENEEEDDVSLTMVLGIYNADGSLAFVETDAKTIAPDTSEEFEITIDLFGDDEDSFEEKGYEARVFLWDSKSYVPDMAAVSFPFENNGMRVASYNIAAGQYPDQEAMSAQFREYDVDIVGLQEVDMFNSRNDFDMLARFQNNVYPYAEFGKAIDHAGGDYGIGMLSKYPLRNATTTMLPNTDVEQRVFQRSVLVVEGKEIAFYNTHLSHVQPDLRARQMQTLKNAMDADPLRYVIATGDFNTGDASEWTIFLEDADYTLCNGKDGEWMGTFPSANSDGSPLDNIIVNENIEVSTVDVVKNDLSDHLMFYADLAFLD